MRSPKGSKYGGYSDSKSVAMSMTAAPVKCVK